MASFSSLPEELQLAILSYCDRDALREVCQTNHVMYDHALPLLWSHIDFQHSGVHDGEQADFLIFCDNRMGEEEVAFARCAALVRSLVFLGMPGINVPPEKQPEADLLEDYVLWPAAHGHSNVFDVLTRFENLERLALYVELLWLEYGEGSLDKTARCLDAALPCLRDVQVGGQIPEEILLALFSRPERIERLGLVDLVETSFEDDGDRAMPVPVLFLEPIMHRFTHLTELRLCKLAELDGGPAISDLLSTADHPQWDVQAELGLLREWARLLGHVHLTVRVLSIENHFAVITPDYVVREQLAARLQAEPSACGIGSSNRCKEVLFPAVRGREWPSLRRVNLAGIHVQANEDGIGNPFGSMKGWVTLEVQPGSMIFADSDMAPVSFEEPAAWFEWH